MHLTRQEAQLVDLMADGKVRAHERLEHLLWGDDPDGGPDNAQNAVKVIVSHLRKKGFRIVNQWGVGYRLAFDPRRSLPEGERWLEVAR